MADKTNYFNVKDHRGDWSPFGHPYEQAKVARIDEEREKQQIEIEISMDNYIKSRVQAQENQNTEMQPIHFNGELML